MSKNLGIVLGGGGITGIAWETGIISGLFSQGIDLKDADKILGTSAGSFVGAALASGFNMNDYMEKFKNPAAFNEFAKVRPEVANLWIQAFRLGGKDRQAVGRLFGQIIEDYPALTRMEERLSIVKNRLVTTEWASNLEISAINADTGKIHFFDDHSGMSLIEGVAASGAVPGVWPHVQFLDNDWIDGGMVSSTNAYHMQGVDVVLVFAPLPQKNGAIPSPAEEVDQLCQQAIAELIIPDERSRSEIGTNIYDASNCAKIAQAGYEQGKELAVKIQRLLES
ncbi:patatin-like phospholipase family protein [Enterococcus hermanniensis]|uniref:PNPLA domain-containing protein n=1 Tax=Enterococcus hermanniensis TaxID=249189 RepID=A0A1L8TJT2_9ENTE|nr:patatin-like phospholipase family protein [Enterococcus hermanniensis]OJG44344.1 hypothetical protein RV04_GL000538 [Enterococcus hermanniensis]